MSEPGPLFDDSEPVLDEPVPLLDAGPLFEDPLPEFAESEPVLDDPGPLFDDPEPLFRESTVEAAEEMLCSTEGAPPDVDGPAVPGTSVREPGSNGCMSNEGRRDGEGVGAGTGDPAGADTGWGRPHPPTT